MKQVMMVKFDSPKWRKVDEYKVANPFVDVGFRQVKDVVDLRVFDLLNISRINNNRAEEMLLSIYHILQPDRRIDEGIYNDEIDQYFSYREWKKKHQPLSGVTVREILATEDLNEVLYFGFLMESPLLSINPMSTTVENIVTQTFRSYARL